jgi:subtilisin-like proprotein convertase family protein
MTQSTVGKVRLVVLCGFVGASLLAIVSSALDFANTNSLVLPAFHSGPGMASQYPSTINVSGLTGKVARVSVTLHDITIHRPDDIEVLLVAPDGSSFLILGDSGGISPVQGIAITLDDYAPTNVPDTGPLISGSYRPSSVNSSETIFPSPAPQSGYAEATPHGSDSFASVFNGKAPNGNWMLFVVDDVSSGFGGAINGGWSLSLWTSPPYNQLTATTTNGNPLVQFTGFASQTYYFQRATNVLGPYIDVSSELTVGSDGKIEFEDTPPPASPETYYRVRRVP